MRVVVAPDGFGGTLSAAAAAGAIVTGWSAARPGDALEVVPMSDGGPGFLDALQGAIRGVRLERAVRDPFGRLVGCDLLVAGDTTYLESAQACGLHLLAPEERDPLRGWTAGVGDLVRAAASTGARRLVVGLGGSATNDGGAGLLDVLGVSLRDSSGRRLEPEARALARLSHVELEPASRPRVELEAATDVDSPLLGPAGASAVYAAQKGASPAGVAELEGLLAHLRDVLARDLAGAAGLEDLPGAGAAGGLGYGFAVLGGTLRSGAELVIEAVGLAERLSDAGLVITGEGSFDPQSLRGKVVGILAGAARAAGSACIVLAGRVALSAKAANAAGISRAYSTSDLAGSLEASLEEPARHLAELAELAAKDFRP